MPASAPRYSLILLTGQDPAAMRAGLASLASLLAAGPCEALVVAHRGGGDDLGALRRIIKELGPAARLLPLPPCPAGAARNQGAEQARGEVLFFSQADCLLPADLLRRLAEDFTPADREAVAGPCRVANRDDPLAMMLGAELAWERQDEPWPDTLCAAYRRRDFLGFGGFDPVDAAEGLENYELAFRLSAEGKELFWDPELQVRRPLPATWGGCLALAYELGRNRFRNLLHRRRLGLGSPGGGRRFAQSFLVMLAVALPLGLWSLDWPRALTLAALCLLLLYPLNRGFIKSVALQEPHLLKRALLWCLLRPWAWTMGMLKASLERMGGGAG